MPLVGCAQLVETPEQVAERRQESCTQAGFAEGSEGYRLCLLIQETNERLALLERRLAYMESDVYLRGGIYAPYRYWP
jgi:hypothetical protein